jgi:hypothetical protein
MLIFAQNLLTQPITIPIQPDITTLYEKPIPSKRRAVLLVQGEQPLVEAHLVDYRGDPYDLTPYLGPNFTVGIAINETVRDMVHAKYNVCTIVDSHSGKVVGPVDPKITTYPGIYYCQLALTDDTLYPRAVSTGEVVISMGNSSNNFLITSNLYTYIFPKNVSPVVGINSVLTYKQQLVKNVNIVHSNVLYLYVDPGIFGVLSGVVSGPPSLAEIRLHLADYPEVNLLLDNYEFDEAEIAFAAVRCIQYFNELPPIILRRFDTKTFPFRYNWLNGICHNLFLMRCNYFRRNKLPYQAGGLSIDDLGKEKEYLQAAMQYGEDFKQWAKHTKVRMNSDEGWSSLGSDYGYYWYWDRGW